MKINIDDAAREHILKKGGNIRVLIQSCHSGGGWGPSRQVTSRIPAVCMGKPIGAIEKLYEEHDCNGISVWVDTTIDDRAAKEINVGYRKFLFFGELTLTGISTQVCVR